MDIATIIGIISGIALIIGSILLNSGLGLFLDLPSFMIVAGGTIASTLIAYPMNEVLKVMGLFIKVFTFKVSQPEDLLEQLVGIATKARKDGILSIENLIPQTETENPFLANALQMVVDSVSTHDIVRVMQTQISLLQKQHKLGWEIFGSMGGFAPAFGMVGTLIGLIQMLAGLDDPASIGPKMAVALITTFYGVIFANMIFLPMAAKLKRRSEKETLNMNLLFEAVMSIKAGDNPRLTRDKLNIYLATSKRENTKR
ncbi:MAG: MotA/TolQ/ExbB proton channel family protein [Desulfobacterales bacterium]|nr:MotA/TolQ/ExbB proton channel family protein [Desulfobacterales bacterium]